MELLFQATLLVDISAMAITLWMAFYLFARGYPSRITLRSVILLLALAVFFFSAYSNLFWQIPGTAALRAVMLIVGLSTWHSLTYQLIPNRKPVHWTGIGIYVLGAVTALLLITDRGAFVGEHGNALYVARMGVGPPYILYGIFQFLACAGILYNLLRDDKIGLTSQGRYFLLASLFPSAGVIYGVFALGILPSMPRLFQDLLVFSGVFLMGLSVARHQTMVERRTTFQDFPLTSLTVLFLAFIYAFLSLRLGLSLALTASVVAFVVITHALYDLVREFLERLNTRKESDFRRQFHQLESIVSTDELLRARLQEGLVLLCQALNASSGLIAIRRGDEFVVTATMESVPVESRISAPLVSCDDICQPEKDQMPYLEWIAPSFEDETQVAVVGIGKPKARLDYSSGDLDLLAEVADHVGTIVSIGRLPPAPKEQIHRLVSESQAGLSELNSAAGGMMNAIASNPDPEFIKLVEEALRNLPDYIALGGSSLTALFAVEGESHIERGKRLSQILIESIESLRPAGKRPAEPLPRVWYNHAVLYDAYVEGVPNREIMARLYISEGTFNRTRRNALRGLARLLMEKNIGGMELD